MQDLMQAGCYQTVFVDQLRGSYAQRLWLTLDSKFSTDPKCSYATDSNTMCSGYSPKPSSWLDPMGIFYVAEPS